MPAKGKPNGDPYEVFATLDTLSRDRALTDAESEELERAIWCIDGAERRSKDALRARVKLNERMAQMHPHVAGDWR